MPRWIVKVGRYKEQVRITIPKMLAVETSLFDARLAEIRVSGSNSLEVIAYDEGEKAGGLRKGNSD